MAQQYKAGDRVSRGANLEGADLASADLRGADLNTSLTGAKYNDQTKFFREAGKAASVDDFSLRDRVLASGKLDSDGRLVAAQINLRTR